MELQEVVQANEPRVRPSAVRPVATTSAAAVLATLALAAASGVIAIDQMRGMDMGVATKPGTFPFFIGAWIPMMAAMMLPSAAPAAARRARWDGSVLVVPWFLCSYLAVWTLVGIGVYAVYEPHGTTVAGALTIAAGIYELTPLKQSFRRRCHDRVLSGYQYGLSCLGSSGGLMATFVALGVMSVTWMLIVAVVVLAQKLVPPIPGVDAALGLAIVGFGILIVVAPTLIP